MLALVLPHRDLVRLVQQDVRGHEDGVGEQPDGRVLGALLGGLVLELCHSARFTVAGDAHEDPRQLVVLRHVRLHKEGGLFWVDAQGQQLRHAREGALTQLLGVVSRHGDGVLIGDEVEGVIRLLQLNELLDCSQVVAEVVTIAGGLQSGHHSLLLFARPAGGAVGGCGLDVFRRGHGCAVYSGCSGPSV